MNSICTAPPRYQFPCSKYGAMRPTPAPKPCGLIAARPGGDTHLPLRSGRTTDEPDFPIRPRLGRHPFDRIFAIRTRRSEDVVVAVREEMTALVHLDVRVSALHCLDFRRHVAWRAEPNVPVVKVVGRTDEDLSL